MYERVGESVIVVCESDYCILMALKKTRNLFLIAISEEKNRQPLDNPLDAPRTHKEPRKTKDEMEDDL